MIWICVAVMAVIVLTFPMLVMWHVNSNDPRRHR